MGNDESRVKGPPNQQVSDFMTSYWNLNPTDRKHAQQILESRKVQLRTLYEYHNVDIPLKEWSLFAETNMYWKESIKRIDRWKRIRNHIKGFATNGKSFAICFSPEYVNVGPFHEEAWNLVLDKAPTMNYQIMVEANGYVKNITDFLNDGPVSSTTTDTLDKYGTFDRWMKQGKKEDKVDEKEEDEKEEEEKEVGKEEKGPFSASFEKIMNETQMLITELGDENINRDDEENDGDGDENDSEESDESDEGDPNGYMAKFYKKKSDAWNEFFSSIEK